MSKPSLNELYASMQQEMEAKLLAGKVAFPHPGMKGDATEDNWIEWFRAYLPKRYAIDKALIIDSNGQYSDQIDIVIYDPQYSYLVFKQGDNKVIPVESVYAVFEVKQTLNKGYIKYTADKAESVRCLCRTSAPIAHAGGLYSPKDLHEIVSGLLTTRCDWTSDVEKQAVKYIREHKADSKLDFVCSIENNTFIVENNIFVSDRDTHGEAKIVSCSKDYSLVFFLLNLLKRLQYIGTVPAIDYLKYADKIDCKYHE